MKKGIVCVNEKIAKEKAKALGIDFKPLSEPGCFVSRSPILKGRTVNSFGGLNSEFGIVVYSDNERGRNKEGWKKFGSEALPGVRCPYCHSQGYRTDIEGVACCGACPGWYFFYEYIDDKKEEQAGYELRLINGQYVKVMKVNNLKKKRKK
jgi:hypothetical protein